MDKQGKGEFVRILRVMETFSPEDVDAGIRAAPERGTIGFDAIKHLVLCRIERLTGALLDRLTHHVHIPEMNGESFLLKQGRRGTTRRQDRTPASQPRLQSLFRLVVDVYSGQLVEFCSGVDSRPFSRSGSFSRCA